MTHVQVIKVEKGGQMVQIAGLDDPDFTDRYSALQQSMLQTKRNQMNVSEKLELDVLNIFLYFCHTYMKRDYYDYVENRETYTSQHRTERCS